jgi:hypothetical protein
MFRHAILAATLLFAATLTACSYKVPAMTPEENQHIEQLTAHMTTRCVGRYLVDLPDGFVLNSEASAEVEGVSIKVTPMKEVVFEFAFSNRKKQLENAFLPGKDKNRPLLKTVHPLDRNKLEMGAIFDRAESENSSDRMNRILELIAWKDGYRIDAHIKAVDTTFPEDENDSIAKQLQTDTPQKLAQLLRVYERVRGLAPGEIPTEPGLCIQNGFVSGKPEDGESIDIAFELKGAPDLFFSFLHTTAVYEDTSLLERSGQVEKEMAQSGSKTIRKGSRSISDHPYEEWLMKGPTPDHVPGTLFTLNANETAHDPSKPFITWELYNGFRVPTPPNLSTDEEERRGLFKDLKKASLSEAEAVALWDKVTATLRSRPGAF